ncbi:Ligand-binding sensor domain-containing protein [Geosporobacter subterraneus DSM 17957]|uniref:Ligand-binding sensor domain-containing protein n=1 Tax=Geosporobacter subterraneus DSM 17957 TaxID=1121919 RepID=A0A1M6PMM9_9FIRM|nr:PocR ligand-binding domain-containing protein [Geosporobacter subterraneus]SHK09204.1 Ligand-binding sensor domain-containing protein [Geosporobacter subterraneus DSM 17957]
MELERIQDKNKGELLSLIQRVEKSGKEIYKKTNNTHYYLRELIDIEKLQRVQESFAKATEFSFVVVDYKGDEITKRTECTEFCRRWRAIKENKKTCSFCDTYGRLESIINQKPNIYRCPAGLVEVTVPIIIKEQYLGAVLFGQVRCIEEEEIVNLGSYIQCEEKRKCNTTLIESYEKLPIVPLKKVLSTANLVQLVVLQMVEEEVLRRETEENKKLIGELIVKRIRAELEKARTMTELKFLKEQANPLYMKEILKTIEEAASKEGAVKTQEMTYLFSEMLKYTTDNK